VRATLLQYTLDQAREIASAAVAASDAASARAAAQAAVTREPAA
jgi:phosphotransferase system enzyme I (PtsI)